MLRSFALLTLLTFAHASVAEETNWTGKEVQLKETVRLGRKLGDGLVRDGAVLDTATTYTVKSDDGSYLAFVGRTGFVFKSECRLAPVKADPIVGTYRWYTGAEFVFRKDGTATAKLGDKTWKVRWIANPYGGYVVMYEEGGVDILKLSDDGDKLTGTGVNAGKTYPVSGTRR